MENSVVIAGGDESIKGLNGNGKNTIFFKKHIHEGMHAT